MMFGATSWIGLVAVAPGLHWRLVVWSRPSNSVRIPIMPKSFDPLDEVVGSDQEFLSASRRREIQNILKSYVGFFDPFAEILQNALDAVDERQRSSVDGSYQRKLWIEINLQTNSFSVTDNGVGFERTRFRKFLAPNITFKSGGKSRGKKGVGATFLAYGFNFLQIGTRTPDFESVVNFAQGRVWVDDNEGIRDRPFAEDAIAEHSAFSQVDRGSTFTLKFIGEGIRPKDLRWFNATTADQWSTLLRLKTPLGQVTPDGTSPLKPTKFDLKVTDEVGNATLVINAEARYVYPHEEIVGTVSIQEILDEQLRRIKKGQDPGKLPDKFKKLNAIWTRWSTDEIKVQLSEKEENLVSLAEQYKVTAYGFFCYSVKVWDAFNDDVAKLRKGQRVIRGGLQIATDQMPQGDMILIPLTSNIGYQNQAHVVVHLENADPDLGRKGFQPELKSLAEEIAVVLVTSLKRWRGNLKRDTGAAPNILAESKLHDWVTRQLDHEKIAPLSLQNPNFFIPINELSITATPVSEQDAIVLFNQLIAGGVIRGIRLLAASQHEQYDAVYRYHVSEPLQNHIFNKETNPLGVQEYGHFSPLSSKPYVLEYKYNMDSLIDEFESDYKSERDIDLVVSWSIGREWKKRYNVTSVLDIENLQHRPVHGITHTINNDHTGEIVFLAIILEELISYLNNVDGVQSFHREKYGRAD